ncbi:MAG: endonuclease [Bacteroidales bacterium]|nr:endonuclease [Bacteroidales bacterium]
MNPYALMLAFIVLVSFTADAQKKKTPFVVLSYNVENLFDTIDAPDVDDDEFTPAGEKKWTPERYEKKLTDIGRVILSLPEKELPALIGLSEVENLGVLEDLVSVRGLNRVDYRIVHEDNAYPRGIECALLYREEFFKYKSHRYVPIVDPIDTGNVYRDILHVSGTLPDGSTLHVFVNHWKSRSGGAEQTERQRMVSAITLRRQLDLLLSGASGYKVIIMGDFNDEPTNKSIMDVLHASNKRKNYGIGDHYNLFYDLHNTGNMGSYNYRGEWNMLDQIIVSYNLLNQERGLSAGFDSGKILMEEWMLYENESYGLKLPNGTYGGPNYYGGPGDHLPVYAVFYY